MPLGFDTVLGTPWHNHEPLPKDSPLLQAFQELIELSGSKALRGGRKLYAASSLPQTGGIMDRLIVLTDSYFDDKAGEDTDAVLKNLGYSVAEIASLRENNTIF